MNKRIKRIVFDIVMLIVYLLAAFPAITGIVVHEWVSLVAIILLVGHCAFRGMFGGLRMGSMPSAVRVARVVLNVLIGLSLATCAVSGIMVSGTVLPTFGVFATGYYFWDPLHALSAKILLALLLVHVALNFEVVSRTYAAFIRDRKSRKSNVETGRSDV